MIRLVNTADGQKAVIKVIGVGGGGCNAVNRMISSQIRGVEFIAANTDAHVLKRSLAPYKIHLGEKLTKGLGAGGNPEIGRKAAEESIDSIKNAIKGADMVFVTCGMGGGTGTGAAPIFAAASKEEGILTVVVATKPFQFEGKVRMRQAEEGLKNVEGKADTILTIPNQKLLSIIKEDTLMENAFDIVDDVLRQAVQAITDVIVSEGLINVDFADVRSIMKDSGQALLGIGEGEGENRAMEALERAITSPLLENVSIKGARGLLANITGCRTSIRLFEATQAMTHLQENASEESHVYWGVTYDDSLGDKIKITVIATNFDKEEQRKIRKIPLGEEGLFPSNEEYIDKRIPPQHRKK